MKHLLTLSALAILMSAPASHAVVYTVKNPPASTTLVLLEETEALARNADPVLPEVGPVPMARPLFKGPVPIPTPRPETADTK